MSINNNLIAISGLKGSGKDCAAEIFQYCLSVPKIFRQYWLYKLIGKIIPKKWKILAFADPLKKMLSVLLNIPVNKFNDRAFKEEFCVNLNTLEGSLTYWNDPGLLSDSKFTKMAKNLDPEILQYKLTIRQLMQYYGSEIMHTFFGKNVWINATLRNLSKFTIISDCRFKAEATTIKQYGGYIIYINRPNCTFGHHQSEREIQNMLKNNIYDIIIDNDGTLKDLFNKVKFCTKKLQN